MPSNEEERELFSGCGGTTPDTKSRKNNNYRFFAKYALKRENIDSEGLDDNKLEEAYVLIIKGTAP